MEPFCDAVGLAVNQRPLAVDLYEERADHGGDGLTGLDARVKEHCL